MTLANLLVAVLFCNEAARIAPPPAARTELNFLPVVGGDSDVGVGGGVIGDLAHLQPGVAPFLWRIEAAAFVTFKPGERSERLRIAFQDYYLALSIPQLTGSRRLRVDLTPSYCIGGAERYYGLGNASPPAPPAGMPRELGEYQRRRLAVTRCLGARGAGDGSSPAWRLNTPGSGSTSRRVACSPSSARVGPTR